MNLLLLEPEDFISPNRVRITGRRHRQLREVIRVEPGKQCKAGILGGPVGLAAVTAVSPEMTELAVECAEPPPPRLPVSLIVALPRPKTFLKVLHVAASMGVEKICFLECWKVDKSYWASPVLSPESIRETLLLALEQSGDTGLPAVEFRRRFKPFVEDEFQTWIGDSLPLLAHPSAGDPFPRSPAGNVTLLIGPEGGFTDYEVAQFESRGARPVSLGRRTLRTEVALAALLSLLS